MKNVKINSEFITLGQFLKLVNLIDSGGEAKFFLKTHKIIINDEEDYRRGRKLYPCDIVEVEGEHYTLVDNVD